MPQLTANFHSDEFFVSDTFPKLVSSWEVLNAEQRENIQHLANRLQRLRELFKAPIHIDSGYRSPKLNRAVKGEEKSYHMRGMAADIRVEGYTPQQVQKKLANWVGGLGSYSTFTHVDIGPTRRWRG